jgi:hypothetical protein
MLLEINFPTSVRKSYAFNGVAIRTISRTAIIPLQTVYLIHTRIKIDAELGEHVIILGRVIKCLLFWYLQKVVLPL